MSNDLFFIIVHWGDQKLTKKAVLSVRDGAGVPASRVIVVENGALSGVVSEQATLVSLPQNGGYATGVNAGIRFAIENGAENILVMNNDLEYVAGAAETMLAKAKEDYGCVGAVVSEGGDKPVLAGGFVDWFRGRTHFVFSKKDLARLHYVSGAFFLITKKCFEDVGEMPERYFHTWEDVAWGFRMRAKGWRLDFAHTPVIPHLASQALSESKLKTYYLVRNGSLFVREYAPVWVKAWLLGLEPLRLFWAHIRGRDEIVKALRDARKNIGGQATVLGTEQGYSVPRTDYGSETLSVVIVTHNSAEDIGSCLQSVKKESVGLNVEIIVVDAGSIDETKSVVQQECSEAKYIQLRNVGFAAAANLGAAIAKGEILFFLNPDAVVLEQALRELVEQFDNRPQVDVVGGLLLDQSGRPEKWQMMPFPSLMTVFGAHIGRLSDVRCPMSDSLAWVSGGALGVARPLFQEVGGFNERYFMYFEDVDFCRRVRNNGLEVALNTKMRILHKGGKSADQESRVWAYDRSQDVYFSLHRPRFEYWALRMMRGCFRFKNELLLGAALSILGVFGVASGAWLPVLVASGALGVLVAMTRFPVFGAGLLFGSLLVGQSVRINFGQFSGTVTDFILPVVLLGLFYAVILRGRLKEMLSLLLNGWWLPVAFLPGILLSLQRLPAADFLIAFSYFVRLFAVLLLIPLVAVLQIKFFTVQKMLIAIALLLSGLGFLQLLVVPVLPPLNPTIFSQLFLGLSGGGWDPHQYRLLATWLDPNFLGMYFVMALGMLLCELEKLFVFGRPVPHSKWAKFGPLGMWSQVAWYWLAGIIIFLALTLTRSRASFLALGAMLLAYFVFSKAKRLFVPILTLGFLALLFSPALTTRIFVDPMADPTVQLRMSSWQQAIRHFENFPLFGMGYNAYGIEQAAVGNVMSQNVHSLAGADNFPLLILATTGMWGVIILLFGMSRFVARLIYRARLNQSAALSILLILIALFTHAQFIQSFTYIHLLLPLVLLIGAGKNRC